MSRFGIPGLAVSLLVTGLAAVAGQALLSEQGTAILDVVSPDAPSTTAAPSTPSTPRTPSAADAVPGVSDALGTHQQWAAALERLADLPVKGRAPKTGYSREQFGPEWSDSAGEFDYSRDGIDTRNNLLFRDLRQVQCKPGTVSKKTGACKVVSGVLEFERYTGKRDVEFVAGGSYAHSLDIEHLVPLSWAWQHGAQRWSIDQRAAFANGPQNFAADPSSNRAHGDAGPAAWLPPYKPYRCAYAAAWVNTLADWDLWVNSADQAALSRILKGCTS